MAKLPEKKPKWQRRRWWDELLGIYRDERIDAINRTATKRAYYVSAVLLAAAGGYQVWQRDWWAALTLLGVIGTIVYLLWVRRQYGRKW